MKTPKPISKIEKLIEKSKGEEDFLPVLLALFGRLDYISL
jgi:hypothetical protein